MSAKRLLLAPLALLVITLPAAAPAQPAPPTTRRDESVELRAKVDAATSYFVSDALAARGRLREQGLSSEAGRFWGSAAGFAGVVRKADPEVAPLFLPILDGFRRTLADAVPPGAKVSQPALAGLQEALDDQVALNTTPGAFPGGRAVIQVEVRSLRAGQVVNNLYASLDLYGAVPRGPSANTLANITSPARGAVVPGRYLVRLRSATGEVGRRDVRIGQTGARETIDVLVER